MPPAREAGAALIRLLRRLRIGISCGCYLKMTCPAHPLWRGFCLAAGALAPFLKRDKQIEPIAVLFSNRPYFGPSL